jgi:FixJ family two-component response regulator
VYRAEFCARRKISFDRDIISACMKQPQNQIFVVEDDPSMRAALKNLLRSVGITPEMFGSAEEFLAHDRPDVPSCLILDVRLPGISGLDLQGELNKAKIDIPIVFITAHGDIPMAVRAIKAGAVEFLTKPFRDQDLLDAIQVALNRDRGRRQKEKEAGELHSKFQALTSRERELLGWVVSGRTNKEIAAEIGMSEITIKVQRANLMRKMQAGSFADLVRMAADLQVRYTKV